MNKSWINITDSFRDKGYGMGEWHEIMHLEEMLLEIIVRDVLITITIPSVLSKNIFL